VGAETVTDTREGGPVLVRVTDPETDDSALAALLTAAGLRPGRWPVVVLIGGAAGLGAPPGGLIWQALFREGLLAGIEQAGACLVDGGTNSGVMALAGAAHAAAGATFPLVGVVAEGTVRWPGHTPALPDAADLEPHHTHVVAVPGTQWGAESPWLARVATVLAGTAPSVSVLINGGGIALDDATHSVAAGRPTVVVAGTGRTADELVAARHGPPPNDVGDESIEQLPGDQLQSLAASPLLEVIEGGTLAAALLDRLSS
jgi:hypothetical protein